jgi:tetratricopeptide (TPR) repeat protein
VHEGTEFLVTVTSDKTEITVFDGQVAATNQQGKIQIKKGFTGIAKKDQPPRVKALTICPEDAVQWTLYYPPLIDYQHIKSSLLQSAVNAYEQGDIYQALNDLEKLPVNQQDVGTLIFKASLLLSVGRVDEALMLIKEPSLLKQNSTAVALQSIIAVAKNKQDKALNLAQQSVLLNPQSAVAHIALSYAYQSNFKIESALEAIQEAVRLSPDNALAWARLSELQLSMGERGEALESAKKAQQLNPKLGRTQIILGFSHLTQVDIDEANVAFNKAIYLNSADPLARLGLGLAKIRKGSVEEGARDLETAVSLDPDNSIMRSYLGKAYYELKEDGYAETELAIAKEMDENDPTPWFYDAIRKQTTNRPVEALHDMKKAIELNDNRGVYRSKMLLDEDLAARSASLGRIYNDLGFQQLGLLEGWKSLSEDQSNYSAHRLLSDNYKALPRHEIARVSELLKSQLLQPINLTPVQPQLAETNLLLFDGLGPAKQSFNEFNPLYTRNRFALQASGIVGSNNTYGDEVVHSGLWNELSYSLGQFHYETGGFRPNSDLNTNLYNVFIQGKVSSDMNLQFEYRRENTKSGDLRQLFNSNSLVKNRRQSLNRDSVRVGFNFEVNPNINIIGFGSYGELHKEFIDRTFLSSQDLGLPPFSGFNQQTRPVDSIKNWNAEIQFIGNWDRIDLISGAGYVAHNKERSTSLTATLSSPSDLDGQFGQSMKPILDPYLDAFNQTTKENSNKDHFIGYLYSTSELFKDFDISIGVSFDYINRDSSEGRKLQFKHNYLNPKFGLLWKLFDSTTLRAAWFKTVKRPFASNQTIEPTQYSGFNQFFDDPDSARSTRYGFGVDQQIFPELAVGGEISWRDMKAPMPVIGVASEMLFIAQKEKAHRAYLYWTVTKNIAFSAEYFYQSFDRANSPQNSLAAGVPLEMVTHRVPLTLTYNFNNRLFGNIAGSFIDQSVVFIDENNLSFEGHDGFWIMDAAIGYRLPKRWGIINLSVKNILDQKFNFQEENFNIVSSIEGSVLQPKIIPSRTWALQLTLAF